MPVIQAMQSLNRLLAPLLLITFCESCLSITLHDEHGFRNAAGNFYIHSVMLMFNIVLVICVVAYHIMK